MITVMTNLAKMINYYARGNRRINQSKIKIAAKMGIPNAILDGFTNSKGRRLSGDNMIKMIVWLFKESE